MPVPLRIEIMERARRCLAEFRLPAELKHLRSPTLAAPSCRRPRGAGAAPEGSRRGIIADDARGADGGVRSRSVMAPPFPSRFSRRGASSHRAMQPLFPSSCNGFDVVDGRGKRGHAARHCWKKSEPDEEDGFFHPTSERAVYEEYLQSIGRQRGEQDPPEGAMTIPLTKYQRMALDWMLFRENSSHCAGGILADEQGLGKTIAVIALILKTRAQQSKFMSTDSDGAAMLIGKEQKDEPEKKSGVFASSLVLFRPRPERCAADLKPRVADRISSSVSTVTSTYTVKPAGGTLIVCPRCILTQWKEELCRKVTKDATLSVLVYHGSSRTMDPKELANYDIVLTTYGTLKQQFHSREKRGVKKPSGSDGLKSNPFAAVRFFRVVLDEAHEIRNHKSLVAEACWKLEAERKWCISGTPMQNKFDDLYSYMRFMRYEPYSEYSLFCSLLKNKKSCNSTDAGLGKTKLEMLLRIILLQRTKETLINGKPIIKLPPKTIQMRKIIFTPEEKEFYLKLDKGCRKMWNEYYSTPKKKRRPKENPPTFDDILKLLKELQQACSHPYLVKSRSDNHPCSTIFERSYVSSKMNAIIGILNSILNKQTVTESDSNIESSSTESAPEKVLVFSQFTKVLDLLEPLLGSNGIQFRRLDGKTIQKAREKAVEDLETSPEVRVLLLSLKAASVGLNLVAASHVIMVEPWWNPFVEEQAIGRAHRIGQTCPVTMYCLAVEGTIEEHILALQDMKRTMVTCVFDGNIFSKKLGKAGLRFLFG